MAQRKATTRAKALTPVKPLVVKGVSSTDADIIAGTLADASIQRMPNFVQMWYCYEKHPWVRACVRLIANAVAQEGYAVATIEGDSFKPINDEDDSRIGEIHQFFRYAFGGRSLRSALISLVVDMEVFGLGYWLEHQQGDLIWYERMDPRLVTPKLNQDRTEIESYILKKSQPSIQGADVDLTSAKHLDAKDVIRFAFEGGDAVLGGPSPLEALDLTVGMDLNIRQHRNNFFINGATSGTYILLPEASEDQARDVEAKFRSLKTGVRNAYSPVILAGQNADVKKFMESGKNEVDFVKGTELSRDEICAVFSLPPGKLLFSSGALGSSGKTEDDDTFQRDCVLPLEELIYERLTSEILLKKFEIEDLALIPKRRASVRTDRFPSSKLLVSFGGTGNEARELVGLPKMDDPLMDEPLFIGATGATAADPGLTKESEPTQGSQGAKPDASSGKVDGANDQQGKQNEVARKAASPFGPSSADWTTLTSVRSRRIPRRSPES